MAQITYRGNLSAHGFPFLAQNWGRSIIVPQYDNAFSRQLTSQEDVDKDVGIPQIYYCHNVMPQQQGFQSIGYRKIVLDVDNVSNFYKEIYVHDAAGNETYLGITLTGDIYYLNGSVWTFCQNIPQAGTNVVTYTYISGVTYIYIAGVNCYTFDFVGNTLVVQALTGLTPADILGITSAAGYMVAWDSDSVAWSSTITPTDFTPSLTTGAGGGSIEQANGKLIALISHIQGIIVYTEGNIVAMLYSGNFRYPFNFREIPGSGGISTADQISYDPMSTSHYAYTTSGLQIVSTTATQTILPEVTDYISGLLFEDYDEVTQTFSETTVLAPLKKKLSIVADRYLVISVGLTSLTHAIVYDITTRRWGKLKINHVQCFEYDLPSTSVIEIPRQSIAFMQATGGIQIVDFSPTSAGSNGVIILGKFQFVRQRLLQLDEIALENVQPGMPFTLYDLVAVDGKNGIKAPCNLISSNGLFRNYGCDAVGINHTLVMQGAFSLVSFELKFHIHGKV